MAMDVRARFQSIVSDHARVIASLSGPAFVQSIERATKAVVDALTAGRRVLICGNGGSAADAQHIAAEFDGHFKEERRPLPVLALSTNSSSVTAIGNDYGYDEVFARQVRGHGEKGGVLIGITTSGNSPNVVRAVEAAKQLGMTTIGLTGRDGGKLAGTWDIEVRVPSNETARIQEVHILVGHFLCQAVDDVILARPAAVGH